MSLDYAKPAKYMGAIRDCYMGYSNDEFIRKDAASGGVVSAILIDLLESGKIDGALVSKQVMDEGKISVKTFIATTKQEILDCRTSIYMDFPLAKSFKKILGFEGKVAVVALPCHYKTLDHLEKKYPELKEKIYLKIALFCRKSPKKQLIKSILEKNKINEHDINRLYFRKGHWRGQTHVELYDGTVINFSYLYNLCTYMNLYLYFLPKCYYCQNHFGYNIDLSCGDVWLKKMKKNPIKHTAVIAKSKLSSDLLKELPEKGTLYLQRIEPKEVLLSQKRALIFKYSTASARDKIGKYFGLRGKFDHLEGSKWNHYLASLFITFNIKAMDNPLLSKGFFLLPRKVAFLYMCFLRFLVNF